MRKSSTPNTTCSIVVTTARRGARKQSAARHHIRHVERRGACARRERAAATHFARASALLFSSSPAVAPRHSPLPQQDARRHAEKPEVCATTPSPRRSPPRRPFSILHAAPPSSPFQPAERHDDFMSPQRRHRRRAASSRAPHSRSTDDINPPFDAHDRNR